MQPGEIMSDEDADESREDWLDAMRFNLSRARKMAKRGNAKEDANRLLEPFAYVTSIMTATDWENWEGLRLDAHSQGAIRELARAIRDAMAGSKPRQLGIGGWHMPYGDSDDPMQSAACCARISYDSHDGGRATSGGNWRLANMLKGDGHWSPFEHQARVGSRDAWRVGSSGVFSGNFTGSWEQNRKMLEVAS
jgi:thymidylate synthase ThyX